MPFVQGPRRSITTELVKVSTDGIMASHLASPIGPSKVTETASIAVSRHGGRETKGHGGLRGVVREGAREVVLSVVSRKRSGGRGRCRLCPKPNEVGPTLREVSLASITRVLHRC